MYGWTGMIERECVCVCLRVEFNAHNLQMVLICTSHIMLLGYQHDQGVVQAR